MQDLNLTSKTPQIITIPYSHLPVVSRREVGTVLMAKSTSYFPRTTSTVYSEIDSFRLWRSSCNDC
jgi:hypothetical protein